MDKTDKQKVIEALGLMNSMILSGELHSEQSHKIFREAMIIMSNVKDTTK